MCFRKKSAEYITSDKDFVVYKVFRQVSNFKEKHYTGPYVLYYEYTDVNGGEYTCENFGEKIVGGCCFYGFHSFKNFNDAREELDFLSEQAMPNEIYEIIPCIIKAGVKYYEGYEGLKEAFLSEKITVNY